MEEEKRTVRNGLATLNKTMKVSNASQTTASKDGGSVQESSVAGSSLFKAGQSNWCIPPAAAASFASKCHWPSTPGL